MTELSFLKVNYSSKSWF